MNILIQALQQYQGTFIIVSHDRHFISQVANKIWFIEDKQVKEYPGSYEEYTYWQQQREVVAAPPPPPAKEAPKKASVEVSDEDRTRQRTLKKLQHEMNGIEKEITSLEQEKARVEQELAKPDVYSDADRMEETTQRFETTTQKLGAKNQQWEDLALRIEEMEAQLAK